MVDLAIASDHGGFRLKTALVKALRDLGYELADLGTHDETSCDYPDFAHELAQGIQQGRFLRGILVCGSGVGMSIAANRHAGIRAALVTDSYSARMSKEHNNANVLCLGERVVGEGLALEVLHAWLEAKADPNARHARRIAKIEVPGPKDAQAPGSGTGG